MVIKLFFSSFSEQTTLFSIIYYMTFMGLELVAAIVGCRLIRKSRERPYKAVLILAVVTFIGVSDANS